MSFQALLVAAIVAALAFAGSTVVGTAPGGAHSVLAAASQKSAPSLAVACGTTCVVGGSLAVNGTGFTPSSGGQQVILWVEYPNDYCGTAGCHGFYVYPWINSDGSFSLSVDNAVLQAGTGGVGAIQYNARSDKWVQVSYTDYATE